MSFVYQSYFPFLILGLLVIIFLIVREEKKFFSNVERFWFKKRSMVSKISGLFFLVGLSLLMISLLDLRGPEERIKTKMPIKRSLILIDTSASMLAEDVRPSRLEKAVLLAKHFSRKAVGHQISVIAFSDIQKKIVPFTADIDLIDARLDSIKGLKNQYGSSALSLAIQESVQYFQEVDDQPSGNILVLTDGEETAEGIDLKIPEKMKLALVGIGTKNGGRIPLDDRLGMRYSYKSFKGSEIITKLNEGFFQTITDKYKNSKYWTVDTYALPSQEIVSFFDSSFGKGVENQDMVTRPVYMQWLVVPGILFLILSYIFKMIRVFALLALVLIQPAWSVEEKKEKVMPSHVIEGLKKLQQGRLDHRQKLGLAYELQKNEFIDESIKLYQEEESKLTAQQKLNYGTALLSSKNFSAGFRQYQQLMADESLSQELKEKVVQNTLLFLEQQEQDKKEQQEKKEQDKKKEKNKDESENDSGEGNNNEEQKKENKDKSKKEDNQNPKKEEKGDENNNPENKDDDKDQKNNEKDSEGDKPQQPPPKLPAKLKQLMSDDRKLQMEMIKRGTEDMNKRKSNSSKDW